jgi:hypothetical protein
MIRKIVAVFLTFVFFTWGRAQVILEPQLSVQGVVQQSQLWNILIINNGNEIPSANFQMTFTEEGSGKKVFSAISSTVRIAKGANFMTAKDFGVIQYDYSSGYSSGLGLTGGLLPIGRFTVCYLLNEKKGALTIAQSCIPILIEPISPPQLAYPENGSELGTYYPDFAWLPPLPANMFNALNYKIIVTEIKNGQKAVDAIQHNPVFFLQDGIKEVSTIYPSSYRPFEQGKSYAWQIIAQSGIGNNTYSAATDVWSFTIKKDSLAIILDNASYPHLQRGVGTAHFIAREKIKFAYNNELGDTTVMVKLYTMDGTKSNTVMRKDLKVKDGMNYIDFDLDRKAAMHYGALYIAEILNSRNENWDIRFRYDPLPK